jgi:hypothetical protein
MGVHTGSPLIGAWHRANVEELQLPELYDLDDVVAAFDNAGFETAVARLAVRFVPTSGRHHKHGRVLDWLEYYYDQKVVLRFSRPIAS